MITVWLIGIFFILIAAINWFLIRWTQNMLRREKRISDERGELVNFLNRVVHSVTTISHPEEWLETLTAELAKTMNSQGIWVFFRERNGTLRLATRAGQLARVEADGRNRFRKSARTLEALNRGEIDIGDGIVGEVALSGRSILLNDVEEPGSKKGGDGDVRIDSVLAVPITMNVQVVGVVCVVNKLSEDDGRFNFDDRFLLESLSSQLALGNTLSEIMDALSGQQRLEQELEMASRIQHSLLPAKTPSTEEFKVHAEYLPALEVGGDYYDFIEINEHLLLVVVADASGKGIPACMVMAMCRTFLRSNASRFKENLEGLLTELNRNIFQDTDASQFVTMACCLVDRRDFTVEYARAGHTELLIQEADGQILIIQPDGPALGLLPDELGIHFDTFSFSWLPGSSIMMFTDGLTEAVDDHQEQYGLDSLIEVWRRQSRDPESAAQGIRQAVHDYAGSQPQEDDQTIVIMNRA